MDSQHLTTGGKRFEPQMMIDREQVARLLARGFKVSEIAEKINSDRDYNYSYSMAKNDIRRVKADWLQSSLLEFHDAKAEQLAKIDELEHQYWEGWFASREDVDKTRVEEKTGHQVSTRGKKAAEYKHTKVQRDKANRHGDPRFLDGVRSCIEMRIQIFGLKVPERLEVDWRAEAQKFGFTTDASNQLMDNLVEEFVAAATKGTTGQNDGSASPDSSWDTEGSTEEGTQESSRN